MQRNENSWYSSVLKESIGVLHERTSNWARLRTEADRSTPLFLLSLDVTRDNPVYRDEGPISELSSLLESPPSPRRNPNTIFLTCELYSWFEQWKICYLFSIFSCDENGFNCQHLSFGCDKNKRDSRDTERLCDPFFIFNHVWIELGISLKCNLSPGSNFDVDEMIWMNHTSNKHRHQTLPITYISSATSVARSIAQRAASHQLKEINT